MWICPKCGEKLGDQFDSCWRCASSQGEADSGRPAANPGDQRGSPSPSRYEFNEEQNETIEKVAGSMSWFSAFIFTFGALDSLIGALKGRAGIAELGVGIFFMATGWLTHSASKAFTRITTTEGDDISHLMKGLCALNNMFRIQLWIIVAALVLTVFQLVR